MQRVAEEQEQTIALDFPAIPAARADLLTTLSTRTLDEPRGSFVRPRCPFARPGFRDEPSRWQYQSLV
jgi:hypothetical protein